MITNDRQRRITNSQMKRFEAAILRAEHDGPVPDVDTRIHAAMIDGMRSQLEDLRRELSEYEALRAGEVKARVFHSLLQIPQALIEGRIARRLTQKALGDKLGVPEQQIQRYEQTRYSGVGLERLQQVADVLEIRVKKTVEYHVPEPRSGASGGGMSSQLPARSSARRKGTVMPITTKRSTGMAGSKKTGNAAASAAGKTLSSKTAPTAAKKAAASDLAQVGNRKVTGKKAASSAGKTLASKSASKAAKKAAASDLSQATKKKR
jgi:transcriptional regulator with XRE-family HTH domain